MGDFFASLGATEKVFAGSAIVGGIFFLVWLVLQFVGGDTDGDLHDGDGVGDVSGDADLSFKVLSFQGISTFLTMFGLVGLASSRESGFSPFVSSALGVAAGLAMAWVVAERLRRTNRALREVRDKLEPEQAPEGPATDRPDERTP